MVAKVLARTAQRYIYKWTFGGRKNGSYSTNIQEGIQWSKYLDAQNRNTTWHLVAEILGRWAPFGALRLTQVWWGLRAQAHSNIHARALLNIFTCLQILPFAKVVLFNHSCILDSLHCFHHSDTFAIYINQYHIELFCSQHPQPYFDASCSVITTVLYNKSKILHMFVVEKC